MAASWGTASTCGRLGERRSSRIKSSNAARAFVVPAPGATSVGVFRPNDSALAGVCAVLAGGSPAKATDNLKQSKKVRILTADALSGLTCVHHTTIPPKDSPTFDAGIGKDPLV